MKLLLLQAYPRKNGYTAHCTELFLKGATEAGAQITAVDLTTARLNPCRGCFHCWNSTPGKCVQTDDGTMLIEKFLKSDLLICATPLYAFAVSSYLKVFQERCLPLLVPGVETHESGFDRNKLRYSGQGPSSMAAIIAGGLKDLSHTRGAEMSLRSFAEGFGMRFCGALIRPESSIMQFTDTKPEAIRKVDNAFIKAGRMLVEHGKIDDELFRKASSPLAQDQETFLRYSNVYWEYASRGGSPEQIRKLTNNDMRILMHETPLCIDPVATRDVTSVVQFYFTDTGAYYYLDIDRGKCESVEQKHTAPDISITCKSTCWSEIVRREKDPARALSTGELKLEGDSSIFRKLGRYFPPPRT